MGVAALRIDGPTVRLVRAARDCRALVQQARGVIQPGAFSLPAALYVLTRSPARSAQPSTSAMDPSPFASSSATAGQPVERGR
jgi:hypothetical protein